jgi:hypothetical protein
MASKLLLPFGLRQGQLVTAEAVANGLACQCECPGCGARLVARNQGVKKAPHFAHHQAPECTHGLETALHLLAKEVFNRAQRFRLPGTKGELSFSPAYLGSFSFDATPYQNGILYETLETPTTYEFAPQYVEILSVALEQRTGDLIPDIVLQTNRGVLLVEIAVTHFVDEYKLAKLVALGISTIEIDLSQVVRDLATIDLTNLLLHEVTNKRWALNLPLNNWVAQRLQRFENEARPHFEQAHRAEQAHQQRQQQTRDYETRLAEARRNKRKPIIEWHIPYQRTTNQVISCPLSLHQHQGQSYANVEQDCHRCRYNHGPSGQGFIICAYEVMSLLKTVSVR